MCPATGDCDRRGHLPFAVAATSSRRPDRCRHGDGSRRPPSDGVSHFATRNALHRRNSRAPSSCAHIRSTFRWGIQLTRFLVTRTSTRTYLDRATGVATSDSGCGRPGIVRCQPPSGPWKTGSSEVSGVWGRRRVTGALAILAYGDALLDADTERVGQVTALGVDETLFARVRRWRRQQWSTS